MSKKKDDKEAREMVSRDLGEVSVEKVLSHPAFRDMANRIEIMQSLLSNLPQAIGEAVKAAMAAPPAGASGPPVPLINPGAVEIRPRELTIDGKKVKLKKMTGPSVPRQFLRP